MASEGSSTLGLAGMLGHRKEIRPARRRFGLLRRSTGDLLSEVRRLNWLVVDLDRGFRDPAAVQSDIEASEENLQNILKEIRNNAGKADEAFEDFGGPIPDEPPGAPIGDRRRGDRRKGERRGGGDKTQDPDVMDEET